MAGTTRAGATAIRSRATVFAVLVAVGAMLIGFLTEQLIGRPVASSSPAASAGASRRGHHPARSQWAQASQGDTAAPGTFPRRAARGEAAGAVRRGLTVFDQDKAPVARLDPDLLGALRQAAMGAAASGIQLVINSGWRSAEYQQRLLRKAVAKYGSEEQAARWVATAETSSHVSGDAVDIGPSRAARWLSRYGASYRLCQIYRNEPWHYELRPEAIADGCPSMYADAREAAERHGAQPGNRKPAIGRPRMQK